MSPITNFSSSRSAQVRHALVFSSARSLVAIAAVLVAVAGCGATKKDAAPDPAKTLQGVPAAGIEGVSDAQLQSLGSAQGSAAPGQFTSVGGNSLPTIPVPVGAAFDDKNPAHHLARCRDHVSRGEWFDAGAACKRAAELAPTSPEPQAELMRIYVTIQSYGDAVTAADRVLQLQPGNAVAFYYLGWAHRGREEYPQAIAALEKAVTMSPGRVEFVQALGLTYCASDSYGKGIARLEQALAMNPGDAKSRRLLDSSKAVLHDKLTPFQKAVTEKPDKPESHARLGSIYQKYGLPEQALAAYDTALAKIPESLTAESAETRRLAAGLYYNRGAIYRELGRPELALPAFARAYEIDITLAPQSYYSIGLTKLDQGDNEGAIAALTKSVELAPKVAENRAALATAFEKAGRSAEAKAQLDTVEAMRSGAAAAAAAEAEAKAAAAAAAAPAQPAASTAMPPPAPASDASTDQPTAEP